MSTGCQKTLCQYVDMSVCRYVSMSICQKATFQLRYEKGTCSKYNIVLNGIRMLERHYVNMSICQNATFQLRYQNESCSKCHNDVRQSLCHYDKMECESVCVCV